MQLTILWWIRMSYAEGIMQGSARKIVLIHIIIVDEYSIV